LPLLQEIRDYLSDQERVNRAIARVDDIRTKMDLLGRTYQQVMQFSQQTEMRRFEKDRKLAAEKIDGTDRQQRQVDRDIENVRAVETAAREFQQVMDRVNENLQRQQKSIQEKSNREAA
jgi:ABC-type iron transport system FetAB ATPase subunit